MSETDLDLTCRSSASVTWSLVLCLVTWSLAHLVVVVLPSIFWLSQTFTVPSFDAVEKMECSSETLMRFTAALCSWR